MARNKAFIATLAVATVFAIAPGVTEAGVGPLPAHPFATAVYLNDPAVDTAPVAYQRVKAAGASAVRILVDWRNIAPYSEPDSWNPADPADPNYQWSLLDEQVSDTVAQGLQPLLTVVAAPQWAQDGGAVPPLNSHMPDVKAYVQFTTALVNRYSGSFDALPRVQYWQAWNEPNISLYLVPQLVNGQPFSTGWYRNMLNGFAGVVHTVHADNLVVSAGLAPFRDNTREVLTQDSDWGPLSFMRDLLCLSAQLKPTCSTRVSFDVWAQHPYTSGGPARHAVLPNDVSLGDLPKVKAVLAAAERYGHIRSSGPVRFWVTEFSWDTNPPDPEAVPALLAQRWTAEALYRMWTNGVQLVTWLMLRDQPMATSYLQSGLYYSGRSLAADRPKPLLAAFRFPVVGLKSTRGVYVWGRTPAGNPASVVIQVRSTSGWRRLAEIQTDPYGVFQGQYAVPFSGWVRATLPGTTISSPPFQLADVPDHFYNPFGQPTLLEPKRSH